MPAVGGTRSTPPERASARPGPLVAPVTSLTAAATARAQRQIALPGFGGEAQRRLAGASVLVVGAGGLGCASAPYLAGAGIGRIGLLDEDLVELSNLHRQVTHRAADVGRPKVDALAETVLALDPSITVDRHRVRLSAENALDLFAEYDLVLDGSDNFPTRYLTNDAAELTGTPLVWGAILQYSGQVSVAWHAHGPGYRDLFPAPPPPESVLNCADGGVLPGLCGTVGALMATEALKLITGLGDPLIGRVLLYDALAARTRELHVRRDPAATPIAELIDYELFCGTAQSAPTAHALGADAADFAEELRAGAAIRVIDVRTAEEFAERRVGSATRIAVDRIEAGDLAGRVGDGSSGDGAGGLHAGGVDAPIRVYCERDPRSIRAAEALASQGFADVRFVRGGIAQLARVAPDLIVRAAADGPSSAGDPEGDA
ncbi:ThiF family adenylyltransferase [Leucobacter sp. USCH14]|uniref:ThiF family adenylyltransferase n=1 Tax=Leucobacter sp. USCH14 TaxID=3024838 RepID=UPI0030B20DE3